MSERTASNVPSAPVRRTRRTIWVLGIGVVLLAVLVAAGPWIIAHNRLLRDYTINAIIASPSLTASSDRASFGWFSRPSVYGLHLKSTNDHVDVRVEEIAAERSLYQLWSSASDVGTIKVKKPHVKLELPLDVQIQELHAWLEPTFKAIVEDARLTVRLAGQDASVIDVDNINMTAQFEKEENGRILVVDPVVITDRRNLSANEANKLVHLLDPTAYGIGDISGEFSLSLDRLRIPIGFPPNEAENRVECEGKLRLQQISTTVKAPLLQTLVKMVDDMYGKKPSDLVEVVKDADVGFRVQNGRMYYEGLRIGLPEIDEKLQISSRGSVGLDKTLDLFVELPRLDKSLRKEKGPAECHITGTVDHPTITVKDGSLVFRERGRKEPVIAVDGIDLKMQVEHVANGHVLVVDPVEVCKHTKLSLGVASSLLKLLAPDVASDTEREVTGEVSLSLSTLRIPLGVVEEEVLDHLDAEGKLTLHQVSAEVKSPMWRALMKVLADMNGKLQPRLNRLVADAEIPFQVREGRLYHEGAQIGFPDIDPGLVISTRGSIGFNETLDLFVDLPRLDKSLRKEKGPAECHITGTVDHPTITVKDGSLVFRERGRKDPVIAVDGIDLKMQIEHIDNGHILVVDPVEVCKRTKLNLGVASDLLKLLAPDVADTESEVTGEVSLSLTKLHIPLGVTEEEVLEHLEAEGKLTLHDVSAEVKSPMWQGVIRLLADMNGKQPPKMNRLAADAEIPFQVREGRLYHEGARIGFPDIDPGLVISTHGSIGLDETLDLFVDLPRLDKSLRKEKGPAECHITGTVDHPTITVKDGSLVFRERGRKEPVITFDGIDLNMQVEHVANGHVLVVDPVEICKYTKLNLGVASGLVKLLAPDLANTESEVTGEVSLSLTKLHIPLGVTEEEVLDHLEAEGKLTLHDVSAEVKSPMWQGLIRLLADMNGKQPPKMNRLVADAEIPFQVREGRLYHEGARIGLPDIDPGLVINTRGSIGLDETLDLFVDLPRLDKSLRKEKGPAECHITGTIDQPTITVKDGSLVLRERGRKEPVITFDGIDLNMQVEHVASGHVLVVDPVEICKKTKLSFEVASDLLRRLAPDVANTESEVDGEVSLSLTKLRIPLGVVEEEVLEHLEAEGKLTLHQVSAEVKSPMWQGLIRLLADMNGKQPPKVNRLVANAEIAFQVREGRLYHEGARIGLPDIDPGLVISIHGSIGLDETLDLFVDLPRLDKSLREEKGPAECHITGTVDQPTITVKDGSLVLRERGRKEPVITFDGIDLNMQVEHVANGHVLVVDPVEICKKTKLNLGVASGLLKLLAPDVPNTQSEVTGEVSLSLTKLRVPLGVTEEEVLEHLEAEGKLTLHQVSADVKSPMWQGLIRLLADMNGKQPPKVIRLVADAEIPFQVRKGRLYHEGARIGLPDIDPGLVISTRGSIGLDETLDLFVDLPRLDKSLRKEKGPVECHITGTILQPKIAIQDGSLVVQLKGGDKAAFTVDNVNLNFGVEETRNGKMLTLAPVTIFEKQKLTPETGGELLHLLVPILSDLTDIQGVISLSIDTFRVPLGVPISELEKRVELAGTIQLHQISATMKTPLLQTLVKMVADMNGKKPSDVVQIVQNADVRFWVQNGRMYHEGLHAGFPDIDKTLQISSRGSVGFDKSLDFELEVPGILLDKQFLDIKKGDTVKLRVTGTIDDPVVSQVR